MRLSAAVERRPFRSRILAPARKPCFFVSKLLSSSSRAPVVLAGQAPWKMEVTIMPPPQLAASGLTSSSTRVKGVHLQGSL